MSVTKFTFEENSAFILEPSPVPKDDGPPRPPRVPRVPHTSRPSNPGGSVFVFPLETEVTGNLRPNPSLGPRIPPRRHGSHRQDDGPPIPPRKPKSRSRAHSNADRSRSNSHIE